VTKKNPSPEDPKDLMPEGALTPGGIQMTKRPNWPPSLVVLTIVLVGGVAWIASAQDDGPPQLSEAEIFFELNDTDGDLGIHASIDGDPWTEMEIEGPGDRELLLISTRGRMRTEGLTQLFIESAEPAFDELEPADFFKRFPEGSYTIEARAQEGGTLEGTVMLSHVMANRPRHIELNGVPAAESCDDPPPMVLPPVKIDWDPVTDSHPEIGKKGPVKISRYQFFVEREGVRLSLDLPPTVTEFEIPRAVTDLGKDFKFEIIARSDTGNNTAVESCFVVP
jgi:hypothetical protein